MTGMALLAVPVGHDSTTLRARLLESARELTCDQGWSAVTMGLLGERVGVSRQSVYNEVGSKSDLAQALVQREFERFLDVVDSPIESSSSIRAAVEGSALAVFELGADNPLLLAVISNAHGANSELLPLLTTDVEPLIGLAVAHVGGLLSARYEFSDMTEAEFAIAMNVIVRLVFSLVMQPGGTPRDDAAEVGWAAGRLLK